MIANRGAVAAALGRWNERRQRIFYPKTDIDFDLEAQRRLKDELSKIDLSKLSTILNQEVTSTEFIPNAGTFHALFRIITPKKRYILKLALEDIAFGFAIEAWVMPQVKPSLEIAAFDVI